MKFRIEHEIAGRMRVHLFQKKMSLEEADILQYYLKSQEFVTEAKVYERSCNAAITYSVMQNRMKLIDALRRFRYEKVEVPESYIENSGRAVNREYWDKLVNQVVVYGAKKTVFTIPRKICDHGSKIIKVYQTRYRNTGNRKD